MRAKLLFLIIIVALAPHPAFAGCDADTIETISEDGDLIVLQSGLSYDVDLTDQSTAAQWSEHEDVLVCDDKIINKDENGEAVGVSQH